MYDVSYLSMMALYSSLKNFSILQDAVYVQPSIKPDFDGVPYFYLDIVYIIKRKEFYFKIFPVQPLLTYHFELDDLSKKVIELDIKTLVPMLTYIQQDFEILRPVQESLRYLDPLLEQISDTYGSNWDIIRGIR